MQLFESYEDIDNSEPCKQIFDTEIAVHLNSFLDCVEIADENERNKHIAYQITKLVSKADGYTYIYHTCNKLKNGVSFVFYCNCKFERKKKKLWIEDISKQRDSEPRLLQFECEGSILITIKQSYDLVYIRIHHLLHPRPQSVSVSSEVKDYIRNNHLLTVS